ncbi:MAG: rhomboid family intramembrane serine protease [Planctomycetota bacterium]|jgi:membrane associated rhomboid family serine protease
MFLCLPVKIGQGRDKEIVPIVNLVLIGVNLLNFGLCRGTGIRAGNIVFNVLTYAFVHASFWHLLGNMWVMWVFGKKVNRRLGNFWYASVCLGTVIAIGIFLRLLLKVNIVGASGVVFAVVAICLILMPAALIDIVCVALFPLSLLVGLFAKPRHWAYWFIQWGRFKVKALWGLFIVPALEIWGLFWWGWNWTNLGHLLGLVCGVGAALILPKRISMNRTLDPIQPSYEFDKKREYNEPLAMDCQP